MDKALRESVSHGTKDFPFACYLMENIRPGFNVPLHWHDEIEVLYIENGSLFLTINGQTYTGHSGDIFFVNPGEIHGMSGEGRLLRYHALLFPLRFSLFQYRSPGSNELYLPLSEGKLLFHNRLSADARAKAGHLIRQALSLQKTKASGYQLGIQLLCARLLYLLYAEGCYERLSFEKGETDIKREILTYLQDNYAEKISLHELADAFHMSEKYFSRYFKRNFQMTLTDYLNSLRLENAAHLLSDTALPVTEVALQSGFNNISYFIRTFKDAFNCSPLHYRKGGDSLT